MNRPEHKPEGEPCSRCGLFSFEHRNRTIYHRMYDIERGKRERLSYFQAYEKKRSLRNRPGRKQARCVDRIIGIDGEGQGRDPHLYTYLAAHDERSQFWDCYLDGKPLDTKSCFDFMLRLPSRSLVVGFALGYDWTKILTDLPNDILWQLLHEESRAYRDKIGKIRYKKVKWKGYRLDYMNRRFTVMKGGRSTTIWDIWRFFQGKFTKALEDWKIGTKEEIAEMARMKDQRAHFDKLSSAEVQTYCRDECKKLALLTRGLITAHEDAGLKLRAYYGAGSTASALLSKIKIKEYLVKPPHEMQHAVACAFFGGWFENAWVGPINQKVYNYDISSAYPYHITLLPCLLHGKWRRVSNPRIDEINQATLACVHWTLHSTDNQRAWGCFPVRSRDGTISFPISAKGGWCWKQEYLAGLHLFSNVSCTEAWLYHTECDCKPFKDIPFYYLERCRLGSGGKGDVYKLGPNSVYGKLVQSKGLEPPFQSWILGGNITSGTRAQLLNAFNSGIDLWNILMFATDSISSLIPLDLPKPVDTGTDSTGKPLGGWVLKEFLSGIFCVRPGIWFPLNPTDADLKEVRARGLGKKILYEQWPRIIEQWEKSRWKKPLIITGRHKKSCRCGKCPEGLTRFVGAKSALTKSPKTGIINRSVNYGEWIPHEIKVSFSPWPKREKIMSDCRLKPWNWVGEESVPYDPALPDIESEALDLVKTVIEEQPNLDL